MKTFSIKDYNRIADLEHLQALVGSYEYILCFLIDKKTNINNEHYKYYENLYLETYLLLFNEKLLFEQYLKDKSYLTSNWFEWTIDFIRKEVTIYDK